MSDGGVEDVRQAVDAAHQAFPLWRAVLPRDRAEYLR